ncbi:hypothetical protein JKP88DRAFT_248707 [Tribonema minus]|uniref:Uncharacterized protein n=1 Tax=Tribonema minus TaxID=303371 RepID=A0A835YLE5_9STRA|nr:hypothetical protein JKP88DRAFT_248707 [Tribonema minus]
MAASFKRKLPPEADALHCYAAGSVCSSKTRRSCATSTVKPSSKLISRQRIASEAIGKENQLLVARLAAIMRAKRNVQVDTPNLFNPPHAAWRRKEARRIAYENSLMTTRLGNARASYRQHAPSAARSVCTTRTARSARSRRTSGAGSCSVADTASVWHGGSRGGGGGGGGGGGDANIFAMSCVRPPSRASRRRRGRGGRSCTPSAASAWSVNAGAAGGGWPARMFVGSVTSSCTDGHGVPSGSVLHASSVCCGGGGSGGEGFADDGAQLFHECVRLSCGTVVVLTARCRAPAHAPSGSSASALVHAYSPDSCVQHAAHFALAQLAAVLDGSRLLAQSLLQPAAPTARALWLRVAAALRLRPAAAAAGHTLVLAPPPPAHAAAVRVQAAYRGHRARCAAAVERARMRPLRTALAAWAAERQRLRARAAVSVQALVRGFLARRRAAGERRRLCAPTPPAPHTGGSFVIEGAAMRPLMRGATAAAPPRNARALRIGSMQRHKLRHAGARTAGQGDRARHPQPPSHPPGLRLIGGRAPAPLRRHEAKAPTHAVSTQHSSQRCSHKMAVNVPLVHEVSDAVSAAERGGGAAAPARTAAGVAAAATAGPACEEALVLQGTPCLSAAAAVRSDDAATSESTTTGAGAAAPPAQPIVDQTSASDTAAPRHDLEASDSTAHDAASQHCQTDRSGALDAAAMTLCAVGSSGAATTAVSQHCGVAADAAPPAAAAAHCAVTRGGAHSATAPEPLPVAGCSATNAAAHGAVVSNAATSAAEAKHCTVAWAADIATEHVRRGTNRGVVPQQQQQHHAPWPTKKHGGGDMPSTAIASLLAANVTRPPGNVTAAAAGVTGGAAAAPAAAAAWHAPPHLPAPGAHLTTPFVSAVHDSARTPKAIAVGTSAAVAASKPEGAWRARLHVPPVPSPSPPPPRRASVAAGGGNGRTSQLLRTTAVALRRRSLGSATHAPALIVMGTRSRRD